MIDERMDVEQGEKEIQGTTMMDERGLARVASPCGARRWSPPHDVPRREKGQTDIIHSLSYRETNLSSVILIHPILLQRWGTE